jgi:hypothetical protein
MSGSEKGEMFRRLSSIVLLVLAGISIASGQAVQNFQSLPRPLVPTDPLELVTGPAQTVQTAEQRAAAVALFTNARGLSNLGSLPYDLKTSFAASGSLPSDGSWVLEDIVPRPGIYRWTAQGPNYSVVNLNQTATGLVYSNQPGGNVPLRLAQVREAIFFVQAAIGPLASIRVATGVLNGVEQRCVLTVAGADGQSFTGGRNWEEAEFCVDPSTGLLTIYSPAPGVYVRYDYSSAKQFHGKTIAGSFTIKEGGRTIVEARTESVSEPPDAQGAIFNPSGLTALGVGRLMSPAIRSRSVVPLLDSRSGASANPVVQVVVLHGNLSAGGQLSETEILASSDPSLNRSALDRASQWNSIRVPNRAQPGVASPSQEIILTYEFVTSAR